MPLPSALKARLEKRGLIKRPQPAIEEEIIAEDYDDQPFQIPPVARAAPIVKDIVSDTEPFVIGCPNKWNPYHECSEFCQKHWGDGIKMPDQEIEMKRMKMLKKYPLPQGWDEVYDPGTGRHYYWNTVSDEVSWLSPKHPRATISLSAAKLREVIITFQAENSKHSSDEEYAPGDEPVKEAKEYKRRDKRSSSSHYSKEKEKSSRGGRSRRDELDPMDPSSYSECPRGTWSSGLERRGEAKTGVDTTASGPLYQMRPYPSPGAVLRANAEFKGQGKK